MQAQSGLLARRGRPVGAELLAPVPQLVVTMILLATMIMGGAIPEWAIGMATSCSMFGLWLTWGPLRRSRSPSDAIVDQMGVGVITTDLRGQIVWANNAAGQMFGYDPREFVGKPYSTLLAGPLDRWDSAVWAMCSAREHAGQRRDHTTFPLDVAIGTVQEDGRPLLLAVLRDATDRLRTEAKRSQAQKLEMVGILATGIVHEIGSPLQSLGDHSRFLSTAFEKAISLKGPPGLACADEDIEENAAPSDLEFLSARIPRALQQVRQGVERISTILNSLRTYAHPGSSQRDAVDLNQVVEDALTISSSSWRHVAEVERHLDSNLPVVLGNRVELTQVALNLVVNAAQAVAARGGGTIPYAGRIVVSTSSSREWVEMSVGDNGIGIPDQDRARVFDLFFTTKAVGQGTGQGLTIARMIVNSHGGSIAFDSNPGQGTAFFVRLPRGALLGAEGEEGTREEHHVCR